MKQEFVEYYYEELKSPGNYYNLKAGLFTKEDEVNEEALRLFGKPLFELTDINLIEQLREWVKDNKQIFGKNSSTHAWLGHYIKFLMTSGRSSTVSTLPTTVLSGQRNDYSENKPTTEDNNLRRLIENAIEGEEKLTLLEHFTTVSNSYTDEFAYAIVDKDLQCIYFLADVVSSLDKQELIARARHIPTVYGYLFYLSEESRLVLDGGCIEVQENSSLINNISYIDFESNFENWRGGNNNITIEALVKDLQKRLQIKYGVSKAMAELLICNSRNTLLRRTPISSVPINKDDNSGCKILYRYLSNEAFFRIIGSTGNSNKTITYGLSSICSMNDRWEYSFGVDFNGNRVYFRDSKVQDTFIMSLSRVSPDNSLDMWRLYGGDARGICLEFEVEPGAPVYGVTYKKDYKGIPPYPYYIKSSTGGWYAFPLKYHNPVQLFSLKAKEYDIEEEARLIVIDDNSNDLLAQTKASPKSVNLEKIIWINSSGTPFPLLMMEECKQDEGEYRAPLILKRVFIGPNAPDAALKKAMIIKRLSELGVNVPVEIVKDFGYKPAK